uniref:Secreted protein n=1 Tax=Steinernema glaseri TaxID=37863 RepID=A0A1I7YWZ0_9BILA
MDAYDLPNQLFDLLAIWLLLIYDMTCHDTMKTHARQTVFFGNRAKKFSRYCKERNAPLPSVVNYPRSSVSEHKKCQEEGQLTQW